MTPDELRRLETVEELLAAVLKALGIEVPVADPVAAAAQRFRQRARKEGAAARG